MVTIKQLHFGNP